MKWVESLKRHADSHYLFYAFSYLMVFPILLKPLTICQEGIAESRLLLELLVVGNLMILSASGIKRFTNLGRYIKHSFMVVGILSDVFCYASLVYYGCIVSGYLILPISVSCGLIILNFVEISDQDRKQGKHFARSVLLCFIFIAIALYLVICFLGNRFVTEFEEITSRGSFFVENGLDCQQISILVRKARLKSAIQMAIAVLLHLGLFFVLFRYLRKKSS